METQMGWQTFPALNSASSKISQQEFKHHRPLLRVSEENVPQLSDSKAVDQLYKLVAA